MNWFAFDRKRVVAGREIRRLWRQKVVRICEQSFFLGLKLIARLFVCIYRWITTILRVGRGREEGGATMEIRVCGRARQSRRNAVSPTSSGDLGITCRRLEGFIAVHLGRRTQRAGH